MLRRSPPWDPFLPLSERRLNLRYLQKLSIPARRNHYDEHLVEAFVSVGIELWLLRNKETNEMVCVNKAEYETIFGTSPPRTFSPIANSVEVEPVFSPIF